MKHLLLSAAVAAVFSMPAMAQLPISRNLQPNTNIPGSTASDLETKTLESQLSPDTPPIGELKQVQQGKDILTLSACKQQIVQQLKAQQIPFENDNFTENLESPMSPFTAYVFAGEQLLQFSCDWAQSPCLTAGKAQFLNDAAKAGVTIGLPICNPDQVIFRLYRES